MCVKGETGTGAGEGALFTLLSTQLTHQVEEDITKISPAMVGLGTVGPRRADHVSEDPFVDVEVL
jgi:hypothetical protein